MFLTSGSSAWPGAPHMHAGTFSACFLLTRVFTGRWRVAHAKPTRTIAGRPSCFFFLSCLGRSAGGAMSWSHDAMRAHVWGERECVRPSLWRSPPQTAPPPCSLPMMGLPTSPFSNLRCFDESRFRNLALRSGLAAPLGRSRIMRREQRRTIAGLRRGGNSD